MVEVIVLQVGGWEKVVERGGGKMALRIHISERGEECSRENNAEANRT